MRAVARPAGAWQGIHANGSVALNGQNFDSGTAQKEAESASGVVDPHLFLYYAQVVTCKNEKPGLAPQPEAA